MQFCEWVAAVLGYSALAQCDASAREAKISVNSPVQGVLYWLILQPVRAHGPFRQYAKRHGSTNFWENHKKSNQKNQKLQCTRACIPKDPNLGVAVQ